MKQSGVYLITCSIDGKQYVGSSVNLAKRWVTHQRKLRQSVHENQKLQRAWDKHGCESFVFTIIEQAPKNELVAREQRWLDELEAVDKGYNLSRTAGQPSGRLGRPHTEATKALIRTKRALQVMTPETMQKLHAALVGRPRPDAVRARISAAHVGRAKSPEHREAIRRTRLGTTASAETRARMSAALKTHWREKHARQAAGDHL